MSQARAVLGRVAAALAVCALPSIAFSQADQALLAVAQAEQPAVVKTLEQLVNIETGTGDAVGLPEISLLLEADLKGLGATVTRHKAAIGVVGDNIVGVLHGRGDKRILLLAHMDTVYPRGKLASAPFRVEGDKAFGPGIADDKSGIAVILHTLHLMKRLSFTGYSTITVCFNADEEQGSRGSRDLIEELARSSDFILSFEPTILNPEALTRGTSGIGRIKVDIVGRAAHAGAAPEQGVNALVEAAELVQRTVDLDQGPGKLRFTWTVERAGDVPNVVPDHADLLADVRYPNNASFEALTTALKKRAAARKSPDATINLDIDPGRPAFAANAADNALMERARAIYQTLGFTLQVLPITGGGTDAAYAAKSGNQSSKRSACQASVTTPTAPNMYTSAPSLGGFTLPRR